MDDITAFTTYHYYNNNNNNNNNSYRCKSLLTSDAVLDAES
jgi:hypothetical protein